MANNDVYIWYSGATDLTGKTLEKELDVTGGTSKPTGKKMVICWGTKTSNDVSFPAKVNVMNHPNMIRNNRNKFTALKCMRDAKISVPVAAFYSAAEVKSHLDELPLVGRRNFHQGGKGFWLCLTKGQVSAAINEGAQYFQSYISIKDEYRLHIFGDECIYAAKKTVRDNMKEAFVEQHKEKALNAAERKGVKIDEDTMSFLLDRIGTEREHPDHIVKSNARGWKFVKVKAPKKELVDTAIAALKALKLDFGAVDCCLDEDGKPWIIEVNTGPGLKGSSLKAWVDSMKTAIKKTLTPPKEAEKKGKASAIPKKVKTASKITKATINVGRKKEHLKSAMMTLADLIEAADDDEVDAIRSAASKMFSS